MCVFVCNDHTTNCYYIAVFSVKLAYVFYHCSHIFFFTYREQFPVADLFVAKSLEHFLSKKRMEDLLWAQCQVTPTQSFEGKHFYSPSQNQHWEHLLGLIVSLPELVSNRLKMDVR